MKEIYTKVLRIARQNVFDNPKMEKIIKFCKYKLDKNVYQRHEITKIFPNGREIETDVIIETKQTKNFLDYQEKLKESKKNIIETISIF